MRWISPQPIREPRRRGDEGRVAFTLIEAVVALALTAFLATAATRVAVSVLDRERRAYADADAARAVRALTVWLVEAGPEPSAARDLPDGWRAVRMTESTIPGSAPEWQSWELFAPGSSRPDHVIHLPAGPSGEPDREGLPGRTGPDREEPESPPTRDFS